MMSLWKESRPWWEENRGRTGIPHLGSGLQTLMLMLELARQSIRQTG